MHFFLLKLVKKAIMNVLVQSNKKNYNKARIDQRTRREEKRKTQGISLVIRRTNQQEMRKKKNEKAEFCFSKEIDG